MTTSEPSRGFDWKTALGVAAIYAALSAPVLVVGLPGETVSEAELLAALVLAAALVALSAIDIATLRLPDVLTLPLALLGVVFAASLGWDEPESRIVAGGIAFAALAAIGWLYERVRGRAGLGLGDAKLLAASATWLGLAGIPAVVLWACSLALAWVAVSWLMGRSYGLGSALAFGPFLAAGTWLVFIYGSPF